MTDADARFCKHCAFDFLKTGANFDANPVYNAPEPKTGNNALMILGGVGALLFFCLVGFGIWLGVSRSQAKQPVDPKTAETSGAVVLSAKAQKVEEKILRGETLTSSDIEGIPTEELRILRNAHFARHGRKYTQAELQNYFQSRSWYKPNDSFNDRMLTSTDKENVKLILTLEKPETTSPVTSYSPTPYPTQSAPSDNGVLTTEKAQNAIDRFASSNGSGRIRIIGGVQELPTQNAAIVKLNIDDFTDKQGRNIRGKDSGAKFTHYTDGRWVLTNLEFSLGPWNGSVKWDTQITVQ